MRCMHHTHAAPLPSCLSQTIIVCLWVTDDIYSPEIYFYHRLGSQTDICTVKKDNVSMKSVQHDYVGKWKQYLSIWKVNSPTTDLKGAVILPESSDFMQREHFTAPNITPKAWESNDHSISILTEKTNRTRAAVCQLVGYSLQTQHRKSVSMWWLLFTSQKEWNGTKEALRRRHLISGWYWSAADS